MEILSKLRLLSLLLLLILSVLFIIGCKKEINGSKPEIADNDFREYDITDTTNAKLQKTHFGFLAGKINDPLFDYDDIYDLGIRILRPHPGPFVWGFIEKQRNVYDLRETDRTVKFFQNKGFQLLAVIWPFNEFDQPNCNPPFCAVNKNDIFYDELPKNRCKPCDMNFYLTFLNVLVDRYDGDNNNDMENLIIPIKNWEILNEPDLDSDKSKFFIGSGIDILNIQIFSYEIIKKADLESNVLHAGAVGMYDNNIKYWNDLFSRNLSNYFDTANIHSTNGPLDLFSKKFTNLLREHKIEKPYWITEVEIGGDEKNQAMNLFKGYVISFSNGAEMIFYTKYKDLKYGIVDMDGTKKESYFTLKTLIKKLESFSDIETLQDGLYRFTVNDKSVYVTWTIIPNEIKNQNKKYILTDYLGNEKKVTIDELKEIEINEPMYIEPIG